MKFLDISEVSSAAGIPPSTLRYYEEIGLIESIARHGLRRQYDPNVLTRLSVIALGKSASFTLDEIAKILKIEEQPETSEEIILDKVAQLQVQIRELTALQKAMVHVAKCSHKSRLECEKFQQLLRIATRHQSRKRKQKRPHFSENNN